MTRRTWRERSDWKRRMRVKFEVEELERSEKERQKERDNWNKTGSGGETWGQRRGNWRRRQRRVWRLGVGRQKGGKDESQGEERGGVRPC